MRLYNTIATTSVLLGLSFGGLTSSWGQEKFEFYQGVRGLGMGGVSIAVVNDETAVLVNPAGLGKLRNYFLTVADPELTLGSETESIVGTGITKFMDPQDTLDVLNDNLGKHLHQKVQVFPSVVFPNFGLGVFAKYETNGEVDAAGTDYTLDYTNDWAAVVGYNFRFFDGMFKLGFNIRAVNRTEIHTTVPSSSTGLTVKNMSQEGFGIASDVGTIITMPWRYLPTLSVVYRDVGGTRYNVQDGLFHSTAERPEVTDPTLDVAIALFPILGRGARMAFSVEYRDALGVSKEEEETGLEVDSMKRVHTGFEINLRDAFFIRAGMNQRYWTAGIEIAMFNYQLQVATYGEEIGTAAVNKEDRRYIGKFAYRF